MPSKEPLYERGRGRFGTTHCGEGEAESRVMWPQAESPEAGSGKELILPSSLWRELYLNPDLDPVTLIANFWPPELRTHFCCSKSPSLWSFVTAAIGN